MKCVEQSDWREEKFAAVLSQAHDFILSFARDCLYSIMMVKFYESTISTALAQSGDETSGMRVKMQTVIMPVRASIFFTALCCSRLMFKTLNFGRRPV